MARVKTGYVNYAEFCALMRDGNRADFGMERSNSMKSLMHF